MQVATITQVTYRVGQNKPPPLILPTSFITDVLSIAYPDVLRVADSESALIFHSRAKLEPVRDLSPQGTLLLAHAQSVRTSISQFMKSAATSSSGLFMCLPCVCLLQGQC